MILVCQIRAKPAVDVGPSHGTMRAACQLPLAIHDNAAAGLVSLHAVSTHYQGWSCKPQVGFGCCQAVLSATSHHVN